MSVSGHSYPTGKIQVIGNIFQFTVDVSEFSPEDVVIIFSNNLMEVHAEKVRERKENVKWQPQKHKEAWCVTAQLSFRLRDKYFEF